MNYLFNLIWIHYNQIMIKSLTIILSISFFLYGCFLSMGLFLLWIRNYYVGGGLGLDHPYLSLTSNTHINAYKLDIFSNFYMLFTASLWPNLPRITSFFLFGAFLISLVRLFNIKIFMHIHPSIILLIVGCLIPGLIAPLIGYYPRYTIKYLPFCILLFSLILNNHYYLSKTKLNKS